MKVTLLGPQFVFASPAEKDAAAETAMDGGEGSPAIAPVVPATDTPDVDPTKEGLGRLVQFIRRKKQEKGKGSAEREGSKRRRAILIYANVESGEHADSHLGLNINKKC